MISNLLFLNLINLNSFASASVNAFLASYRNLRDEINCRLAYYLIKVYLTVQSLTNDDNN